MADILFAIRSPWPWYIGGPLIGLLIPVLLIMGNRSFGISSSLRHICAAVFSWKIDFFRYDWKKEAWILFFAVGISIGGLFTTLWLTNGEPISVNPKLAVELFGYGITRYDALIPIEVMNWESVLTLKGFLLLVCGGFMIGFGTRYAGGCTSGHSIMGMARLQWPSLVATCCFMIGGMIMANFILPHILSL